MSLHVSAYFQIQYANFQLPISNFHFVLTPCIVMFRCGINGRLIILLIRFFDSIVRFSLSLALTPSAGVGGRGPVPGGAGRGAARGGEVQLCAAAQHLAGQRVMPVRGGGAKRRLGQKRRGYGTILRSDRAAFMVGGIILPEGWMLLPSGRAFRL